MAVASLVVRCLPLLSPVFPPLYGNPRFGIRLRVPQHLGHGVGLPLRLVGLRARHECLQLRGRGDRGRGGRQYHRGALRAARAKGSRDPAKQLGLGFWETCLF